MNAFEYEEKVRKDLELKLNESCDFFNRVSHSYLSVTSEIERTDIQEYKIELTIEDLDKEQVLKIAEFIENLVTKEI